MSRRLATKRDRRAVSSSIEDEKIGAVPPRSSCRRAGAELVTAPTIEASGVSQIMRQRGEQRVAQFFVLLHRRRFDRFRAPAARCRARSRSGRACAVSAALVVGAARIAPRWAVRRRRPQRRRAAARSGPEMKWHARQRAGASPGGLAFSKRPARRAQRRGVELRRRAARRARTARSSPSAVRTTMRPAKVACRLRGAPPTGCPPRSTRPRACGIVVKGLGDGGVCGSRSRAGRARGPRASR